MKTKIITSLLLPIAILSACKNNNSQDTEKQQEQRTEVTLVSPVRGSIATSETFIATTAYLDKATVASPFAAFVKRSHVQTGMHVRRGQLLYLLENKEQHALQSSEAVEVRAAQAGIVLDVQAQTGSYVAEGSTLCTVADANSLVFEIQLPYERHDLARSGSRCTILLPSGLQFNAVIQRELTTMNTLSQTFNVVAKASVPPLPEGLNAQATFRSGGNKGDIWLLPKAAVQSDEALTEQWVMVVGNDSVAHRVSITVGDSDEKNIEVTSPELSAATKVILSGSYALEDGAKVKPIKGS